MMRKSILVLAVCAALTVAGYAAVKTTSKEAAPTVGQFVVQVSKALGYSADSPEAAARELKKSGVNLEADYSARLTEATAARLLSEVGIRVEVRNPNAEVPAGKADQLAIVAGQSAALVAPAGDIELPTACLNEPNRGICVECCKAIVGPIENIQGKLQDPGKICAKWCNSVVPPGHQSPSEPTP